MKGTLYGVGVGPGDPELMTLKAVRMIRENEIIAVPGADVKTRSDAEHYAGWAENRRVPGSDSGRETEIRRYFERKEE